jgi:hypothetical protein
MLLALSCVRHNLAEQHTPHIGYEIQARAALLRGEVQRMGGECIYSCGYVCSYYLCAQSNASAAVPSVSAALEARAACPLYVCCR